MTAASFSKDKKLGEREDAIGKLKRMWYYLRPLVGIKLILIGYIEKHRKPDLSELEKKDKTINLVITGATGGIGAAVVKQCLQYNMHVIMGCRNPVAGEFLVKSLRLEGITSGSVECHNLDLNSLESVKEFANFVISKGIPIHVLINNAGILFRPFQLTKDGFDSQFQTNYLSHFLLTLLLRPALEMGGTLNAPSRVVNVSSAICTGGRIDFDNIDMRYEYSPPMAYMNSKLMMVITGNAFNRRFQESESNIVVFSLHPGAIRTNLFKHISWATFIEKHINFAFHTPDRAADGIMFVAFSPTLKHNEAASKFYFNCKGYAPHPLALDLNVQDKLYNFSMELCGLNNVTVAPLSN